MTSFQDDINLLSNWVADNHLALNAVKTKFMFRSHSHSFNFPPLLLNGSKLGKVSHFKHLGVWISLLKHIESICSKSHHTLGYIFRTFSLYCDPCRSNLIPLYINPRSYQCWSTHVWYWDPHRKIIFSNPSNYLPPDCRLEIGLLTLIP